MQAFGTLYYNLPPDFYMPALDAAAGSVFIFPI